MKIAYFDCQSGISGDMTLAAMIDAGVSLDALNDKIHSLELPGLDLTVAEVHKKGFRAAQVTVHFEHEHVHRHLADIVKMIDGSNLTDRQKQTARDIFQQLGEAEAKAHGVSIEKVHFHEVGAADSIADIVGAAVGLDLLGVDRVIASPVPTGTGKIKIAHGLCSVPAPATAELFRVGKIPVAASEIRHELTTPTGAAILATQADSFGPMPAMTVQAIGYGAGTLELDEQPNLLRLIVGEIADDAIESVSEPSDAGQVWVIETNIDDASGELIGDCIDRLWSLDGVLDVYTTPIQMKKQRPGVTLTVLGRESAIDRIESILFHNTTTIGIRRWPVSRSELPRTIVQVETPWGPIQGKRVELPDGGTRVMPEYDACREVSRRCDVPLQDVYEQVRTAFRDNTE